MGKSKKIVRKSKVSKGRTEEQRVGLADQIELEKAVKLKNRQKVRRRADDEEEVSLRIYFLHRILYFFLFSEIK